jgi:DNA-binding transcriptional ArsR family regulator
MNINKIRFEKEISNIFSVLGNPFRVKLLYTIGQGESCVCHLEPIRKKRQAYISQHLMVLRDAGILETRRDGKYIFYRIANKNIFEVIETAAAFLEFSPDKRPQISEPGIQANCVCPSCAPEITPTQPEIVTSLASTVEES